MTLLFTRKIAKRNSSYTITLPIAIARQWVADGVAKCDIEYEPAGDRFVVIPVRPGGGKK